MRIRATIMAGAACVLALGTATGAERGPADADAQLERLQAWLDGTRTLEARFEQELVSGALGAGLAERGRVLIRRPGRMRWDYLEPERKVAIVDGVDTGLWIEEDRQYVVGTLDEGAGLLPALLTGERPLSELFRASLVAPRAADDPSLLRLDPVAADAEVGSVLLLLRPRDGAIQAAEVEDSAGNRMIYRFGALRRNHDIPDAEFEFTPPEGVEIVGR